jgi:hypothetical protein
VIDHLLRDCKTSFCTQCDVPFIVLNDIILYYFKEIHMVVQFCIYFYVV